MQYSYSTEGIQGEPLCLGHGGGGAGESKTFGSWSARILEVMAVGIPDSHDIMVSLPSQPPGEWFES